MHRNVCVVHIKPIFPTINFQHLPCQCRCLILERASSGATNHEMEIANTVRWFRHAMANVLNAKMEMWSSSGYTTAIYSLSTLRGGAATWRLGHPGLVSGPPVATYRGVFAALPITIGGQYGPGLVAGDKNSSRVRKTPVSPSLLPLSFARFSALLCFSIVWDGVFCDMRNFRIALCAGRVGTTKYSGRGLSIPILDVDPDQPDPSPESNPNPNPLQGSGSAGAVGGLRRVRRVFIGRF